MHELHKCLSVLTCILQINNSLSFSLGVAESLSVIFVKPQGFITRNRKNSTKDLSLFSEQGGMVWYTKAESQLLLKSSKNSTHFTVNILPFITYYTLK